MMKEYVRKLGLTHKTTPSFSPWSNGLNERNHSTVDRSVTKIRIQNPEIPLQEAVDLGCFWKNQEIRKTSGFSSHQLIFGRGVTIPGVIDGDIASDSPAYNDEVAEIFARHSKARQLHLEADTDNRIKKLLATRNKEYNNFKFQEGDRIFVKDLHKELWEGPVLVMNHQGNNVTIVKEGRVTSVPIQRVIPYVPERPIETVREELEEEMEKERIEEEGKRNEAGGKKGLRPKKGSKVEFSVEGKKLQGIIKQVGKKTGRDKNSSKMRPQGALTSLMKWKSGTISTRSTSVNR